MERGVSGGGGGGRSLAEAAKVGGDGAVAGGSEGGNLVAPRVPELGEAVEEEHDRAGAFLRHVHGDAVHLHFPPRYPVHLVNPPAV